MKFNKLPESSRIIFKGIVGSQAYNLHTIDSDIDIKGVFIQSNSDILSNNYIPQINVDADTVYYEIRRFLELVSVGNPNVLELLYLPERCIVEKTEEWDFILKQKEEFLSKKCYNTFSGYAKAQLNKSKGLNKKFNWEKSRTERKTILDFCKVVSRDDGLIYTLKKWLQENEYDQSHIGLTSLDGFRDSYKVYTDDIKFASDNHRFKTEDFVNRGYRGIGDENTNEPKTSMIEKYRRNDWKAILYFNREQYSIHCKEYREYSKWLKNRNEIRAATNKKHGQQYDGKNLLHTVRLIMTAAEIPLEKSINVDRSKDREYLLSVKKGEVDLKKIVNEWSIKAEKLKDIYSNSDLKEEVSIDYIKSLELKIRNNEL